MRVKKVFCFVVDETVDAEELAGRAIVVFPAGTHLESTVAAARGKCVAAVVDHNHGPLVAVFIGDG